MGIEPTQGPYGPYTDFEDQERHQAPVPDARFARQAGQTRETREYRLQATRQRFCNHRVTLHRHRTPLGKNCETLDELSQLFLFDHCQEIAGPDQDGRYLGQWATKWTAVEAHGRKRMLAVPPDQFDLTGSEGKQKGPAGLSRQISIRSQPPARASNRLIWLSAGHRYRAEV